MKNNFKLFVFICMFFFCLFLPKLEAGQELPFPNPGTLVSMDFQDASLKDILKIFSIQSGLNFIASDAVKDRKFTLYFDSVSIKDALDKIFIANNLAYDLDKTSNIFIVNDLGAPEIQTVTKIFFLKHASVSTSNIISDRDKTESITTKTSGAGGTKQAGGISEVVSKLLSEKGKIIEDPRTNSLIVTDIPTRMPVIAEVIAGLDISQQQILLEVEMMDVSKATTDKIGLKFGDSPLTLNTVLKGAVWGTKFPFGSPFGNRDSNYGLTNATFSPQYGYFDVNNATPSTYQIVLDFIKTQADTRFLARPRILTLNNETAEISMTKDEVVGRVDTTTYSNTGAPTVNTEFKRSTDLTLTKEGTGIFLRVTPQINLEANEVTMMINPKSSTTSISALSLATNRQSDVEIRATKSMIRVKDGETIVLGGLIRRDYSNTDTKLPFFGDLPLIGRLFTNKTKDTDKDRELLIFITPHIIKDTPIQLAQARKGVLPEREQSTVSRVDRQGVIDASLQNFERKRKNK